MIAWAQQAKLAVARDPTVLVSVLATEGSAPRAAGTRMIVTPGAIIGTIGGGALEYRVIEQARAILAHRPGSWRVQDYPLGPLLGQCCGGRVRLLVEKLDPDRSAWLDTVAAGRFLMTRLQETWVDRVVTDDTSTFLAARGEQFRAGDTFVERIGDVPVPVFLFGAGHVGKAIARALVGLPFALAWFDPRPEMDMPGLMIVADADLPSCINAAPKEAAILILTHDHGLDYRLTAEALRSEAQFVGLIGSSTKKARFLSRLQKDDVAAAARARLVCPIGLRSIVGKEPEIIAIAVAAQLLRLHQYKVGNQL